MKIKSNNIIFLHIFCIYFVFILIYSIITLSISNGVQLIFSQGYIPPPPPSTNSIQSQPQQQQQLSPPQQQQQLSPPQQQQQQNQNVPLTTTNNINTLVPLDTELEDRMFDKIYSCANDLTGKWIANDGGVYYIKQDGNKIRWFGSTLFNDGAINSNKGFSFSNEAQGDIIKSNTGNGTQIYVNWDDIQVSDNHLKGTMTLFVYPSGTKIVTIYGTVTGGFGGSEWTRKC